MGMLFLPFGKNACSLLAYLLWVRKVAWQQMELLRFSCVASFEATHFYFKTGGKTGMKKWTALLLALVMCLALCACGREGTDEPEPSSSPEEELIQDVRGFINIKCMYSYEDVRSTQATVHIDNVETNGTKVYPDKAIYSVSGKVRITDAFGDQYDARYTGEWTYKQDGSFSERSFNMDTPVKVH